MDLKSDSSGRGWLHINPGQSESGSTLTTSVDVGRIQGVRWQGPRPVSGWLRLRYLRTISVVLTLLPVVVLQAILDVLI